MPLVSLGSSSARTPSLIFEDFLFPFPSAYCHWSAVYMALLLSLAMVSLAAAESNLMSELCRVLETVYHMTLEIGRSELQMCCLFVALKAVHSWRSLQWCAQSFLFSVFLEVLSRVFSLLQRTTVPPGVTKHCSGKITRGQTTV